MKNILKKLFIIFILLVWLYSTSYSAAIDNFPWIDSNIKWSSVSTDVSDNIEIISMSLLSKVKLVLSWVILIFIVYAWAQMVLSMWSNEEQLSSSKRTLWYAVIWFVFINIPWILFQAIKWNKTNTDWWVWTTWSNDIWNSSTNLFINTSLFQDALNNYIIKFLEVSIWSIAVIILIISWLKILTSRWREEQITEWKNKIIWSIVWLIFLWFINAWQSFIYNWNISDWKDIFETIANLVLFLAWPIAIFFLSLAWYYFITSSWEDEKVKKWKDIVINTVIWTVIILCSYIFLNDLITL